MTKEISLIRNITTSNYTVVTRGIDLNLLEERFKNRILNEEAEKARCVFSPSPLPQCFEDISNLIYILQRTTCNLLIGKNEVSPNDYLNVSYPYRTECFRQGITSDISKTIQANCIYDLKLYGRIKINPNAFLKQNSRTMRYQMRKYLEEIGELQSLSISRCLSVLTVRKQESVIEILDSDDCLMTRIIVRDEKDAENKLYGVLSGCAGVDNVQKILFYGWKPSKQFSFNLDLLTSHTNSVVYVGEVEDAVESTDQWFGRTAREVCRRLIS